MRSHLCSFSTAVKSEGVGWKVFLKQNISNSACQYVLEFKFVPKIKMLKANRIWNYFPITYIRLSLQLQKRSASNEHIYKSDIQCRWILQVVTDPPPVNVCWKSPSLLTCPFCFPPTKTFTSFTPNWEMQHKQVGPVKRWQITKLRQWQRNFLKKKLKFKTLSVSIDLCQFQNKIENNKMK